MEPKVQNEEDRPDSPQSSSSSRSDLSSPSFNRDSEFDGQKIIKPEAVAAKTEKEDGCGSFENESDSNSTNTTKTIVSGQTTSKESIVDKDMEKRRIAKVPVRIIHLKIKSKTKSNFNCYNFIFFVNITYRYHL